MTVQVLSLRLIEPKESGLRGFADIRLDAILVRDFRIVQRNGKPFVEGPHTTRKKDGQMFFNQIITFPEELRVEIDTAILAAYFREKEKNHGQRSE